MIRNRMSIKSIDGQSISMICIDEKLELSLLHLYCPPLVTEQPLMVRGTSVYNGQPIVRILPLATFVLDILYTIHSDKLNQDRTLLLLLHV